MREIDCLGIVPGKIRLMEVGNLRLPPHGLEPDRPRRATRCLRIHSGSYFYCCGTPALEVTEATLAICDYGRTLYRHRGPRQFLWCPIPPGAIRQPAPVYQNFLEL